MKQEILGFQESAGWKSRGKAELFFAAQPVLLQQAVEAGLAESGTGLSFQLQSDRIWRMCPEKEPAVRRGSYLVVRASIRKLHLARECAWPWNPRTHLHHKYGHSVWMTPWSSPVRGESGDILGAVEVITSNTKRINVLKEVGALRMSRRLPGPFPD